MDSNAVGYSSQKPILPNHELTPQGSLGCAMEVSYLGGAAEVPLSRERVQWLPSMERGYFSVFTAFSQHATDISVRLFSGFLHFLSQGVDKEHKDRLVGNSLDKIREKLGDNSEFITLFSLLKAIVLPKVQKKVKEKCSDREADLNKISLVVEILLAKGLENLAEIVMREKEKRGTKDTSSSSLEIALVHLCEEGSLGVTEQMLTSKEPDIRMGAFKKLSENLIRAVFPHGFSELSEIFPEKSFLKRSLWLGQSLLFSMTSDAVAEELHDWHSQWIKSAERTHDEGTALKLQMGCDLFPILAEVSDVIVAKAFEKIDHPECEEAVRDEISDRLALIGEHPPHLASQALTDAVLSTLRAFIASDKDPIISLREVLFNGLSDFVSCALSSKIRAVVDDKQGDSSSFLMHLFDALKMLISLSEVQKEELNTMVDLYLEIEHRQKKVEALKANLRGAEWSVEKIKAFEALLQVSYRSMRLNTRLEKMSDEEVNQSGIVSVREASRLTEITNCRFAECLKELPSGWQDVYEEILTLEEEIISRKDALQYDFHLFNELSQEIFSFLHLSDNQGIFPFFLQEEGEIIVQKAAEYLPWLLLSQIAPMVELQRNKEVYRAELNEISGSSVMSIMANALAEDAVSRFLSEKKEEVTFEKSNLETILGFSQESRAFIRLLLEDPKWKDQITRTLEAALLKNFINIAKHNLPSKEEDSLMVVTQKLLEFTHQHYFEIIQGKHDVIKQLVGEVLGIDSAESLEGIPPAIQPAVYTALQESIVKRLEIQRNERNALIGQSAQVLQSADPTTRAVVPIIAHLIGEGVAEEMAKKLGEEKTQEELREKSINVLSQEALSIATVLSQYHVTEQTIASTALMAEESSAKAEVALTVAEIMLVPLTRFIDTLLSKEAENPILVQEMALDFITLAADHFVSLAEPKDKPISQKRGEDVSRRNSTEHLLGLIYPGGSRDLLFLPEEKREEAWNTLREEMPHVVSNIIDELVSPDMLREFMIIGLETANESLKGSVEADEGVSSSNESDEISYPEDVLDEQLGRLTMAVLKGAGLDKTVIGKIMIDSTKGKIDPKMSQKMGALLREKLQENFIEKICGELIQRDKSAIDVEKRVTEKQVTRTESDFDRATEDLVEIGVRHLVQKMKFSLKSEEEKLRTVSLLKNIHRIIGIKIRSALYSCLVLSPIRAALKLYVNRNRKELFRFLTQPVEGKNHLAELTAKIVGNFSENLVA